MTDQQRFDTLFAKVGDQEVTPTWNTLAKHGTYFSNTYTSCPLCVPARTSLATGMNPLRTGMVLNDLPGKLAKNHTSLHRMLYEAGYEVAHIGVNHISLDPKLEQSLPFAAWEDDHSYEAYAAAEGFSCKAHPSQRSQVSELCDGTYENRMYSNNRVRPFDDDLSRFKDVWFTDKALDFIAKDHAKPFALFVCLWAPHPPLVVPPAYQALFNPDDIHLGDTISCPAIKEPQNRRNGAARQLGANTEPSVWKKAWAAHYALTRLCDDQLIRLVQELKQQDLFDDTLLVCTADHGEQLGEHAMYQKMEMYESAVRVPAVIHLTDATSSVQNTPISHLDFVPTILDLLHIPCDRTFEGSSLARTILEGAQPPAKPVFSVYSGNHAIGDIRRMIVHEGWKYVWDGMEAELFHLEKDPGESINLSGLDQYRQREQQLHRMLSTWARQSNDWIDYTRTWA